MQPEDRLVKAWLSAQLVAEKKAAWQRFLREKTPRPPHFTVGKKLSKNPGQKGISMGHQGGAGSFPCENLEDAACGKWW